MALDARYITAVDLEEYFVDKSTGEPLAFGTIQFWQDDNRLVPKNVFTISGAPPNYVYVPLPNPIVLSATGTISDANGNNVPVYYFPFDANDNIQLYYVKVFSAAGLLQFDRQAWPNTSEQNNPAQVPSTVSNQISNPQFVDFLTAPNNSVSIDYTGAAINEYKIAPDWTLRINHSGAGTAVVTRTPIAGNLAYPNNPPYTLSVTPGNNTNAISLYQTFLNNPNVFGRPVGAAYGFVATSILLAPGSSLDITYEPSGGGSQQILQKNNLGGQFAEFKQTTQLLAAANPNNGDTGFVRIYINLPVVGVTTFGNVQIVGVDSDISDIPFDPETSNRQRDHLFNYYNPLLQYKPVKSFLTGWDFHLNPCQERGTAVGPLGFGANSSLYFWDQTIVFQAVNNGITSARASNGSLTIASPAGSQFALIQYLPANIARNILTGPSSVNIVGITGVAAGLNGFVHLLYTTDAVLPNMAANASVVATLNANGSIATANGNWSFVPRNGISTPQSGSFNLPFATKTNVGISGFDGSVAGSTTATYFAIVVGFAALGAGDSVNIQSISLVPGNIPTIPAPQTQSEVLYDCRRYVNSTFEEGTVPAQNVGVETGENMAMSWIAGVTAVYWESRLNPPMHVAPSLTLFNPAANNAQARDETTNTNCSGTSITSSTENIRFSTTANAASVIGSQICLHWLAKAQLGF